MFVGHQHQFKTGDFPPCANIQNEGNAFGDILNPLTPAAWTVRELIVAGMHSS